MSALFEHLKSRIQNEGPLSLDAYMAEALSHPEHGYYWKGDPLGSAGDFVTAPEISQMFGELLGLWSVVCWRQLGAPATLNLIELGPGRGTLMADGMRAAGNVAAFYDALRVHLVETSPVLRKLQQAALAAIYRPIHWHDQVDQVPDGPFILLANEFLDALPIRQFVSTDGGWQERSIGLTIAGDALKWTSSALSAADGLYVPPALATGSENQIYEVCPAAHIIIREISRMIMKHKGVALFIDYGYAAQTGGDTFQAVADHQYADPLAHPGDADLTAHVDFEAVARLAGHAGVRVSGPVTQGTFLLNLGIGPRADTLMDAASSAQKRDIETALERLTGDDAMGGLFKVIALSHPDLPDPRGF